MKNLNRNSYMRMDSNENPYGCSPAVLKILRGMTAESVSVYPDVSELAEDIAGYIGCGNDCIAISNGSDDLIRNVIEITVKGGQKAVLPVPTFSMNKVFLNQRGAEVVEIETPVGRPFPYGKVTERANSSGAELIMIVNPSVPYGYEIERADIERVLKTLPQVTVLVDEAYGEFSGNSVAALTEKYRNLIVIKTFSKAFGLAGARVGYSVSNPETAEKIRSNLSPYSASSISIKLAKAALKSTKWMKNSVKKMIKSREELFSALKGLGLEPIRSEANYITFFSPFAEWICSYLKSEGMLVRYFEKNGGLPEKAVRISVGTEKENRLLLKKLGKMLRPKAVIFDMDGVLIDVSGSYLETIRLTFKKLAKASIKDEEIEKLRLSGGFNNDWMLTYELLKRRKVNVSYLETVRVFQEIYLGGRNPGLIGNETLMIKKSVLKTLSKKYKLGVFTGRPENEAEFILRKFNIGKYFTSVVTMDDVRKQKPDPEGALTSLRNLGEDYAVYLGDTVDDMKCARNSNCIGVGVVDNSCSKLRGEALLEAGAAFVVRGVNEIGGIL